MVVNVQNRFHAATLDVIDDCFCIPKLTTMEKYNVRPEPLKLSEEAWVDFEPVGKPPFIRHFHANQKNPAIA